MIKLSLSKRENLPAKGRTFLPEERGRVQITAALWVGSPAASATTQAHLLDKGQFWQLQLKAEAQKVRIIKKKVTLQCVEFSLIPNHCVH